MTTTQIEDFINDNIVGRNIYQAEEELKTMFSEVDCYDEDIYDGVDEGNYIMYKGFNCETESDEYFDVTLYYVNDVVTDYRIR